MKAGYALRMTALAFELMVLTASRGCEIRGMTWAEVDLEAAVWEIPAGRMKARRPHRVPLPAQALAILRRVRHTPNPDDDSVYGTVEITEGHVFRTTKGKPLSERAIGGRCKKDNIDASAHGFRTSFRSWAKAEHGARFEAIELCLAHSVGTSTVQAYDREDLLEERRGILQSWADYVSPSTSPF